MTTAPAEKVRIGTSGFSYDDWRGVFYPEKIKKGMMLEYYARHFNTVELNSPYYAIPARSVFYRMEQKRRRILIHRQMSSGRHPPPEEWPGFLAPFNRSG